MKRQLLIVIGILSISVIAMESCFKKGPGDPLISFRSRLERISGKWNCTKYEINSVDSTSEKEGDTLVRCSLNSANIHEEYVLKTNSFVYTFDHNGHYQIDSSYTLAVHAMTTHAAACGDTTFNIHVPAVFSESGTWNFLGKVGQYKKYESLVTYDQNLSSSGNIYHIYELSEKTLILERTIILNATTGTSTTYRWTFSRVKS